MKKLSIIAMLVTSAISSTSNACTTILVGNHATVDNSYIVARNEDRSADRAKHFILHPATHNDESIFKSHSNDFTYPNPKNGLQYTSISDYDTQNKSFGSAGFNSAGVGMSATETVYNNDKVMEIDPYLEKTGINEDSIENVILPRIHSAKEGVELLGHIIETQGIAEGFGVSFVDNDGIWYLETGSGHQWMAEKIPADKYFVSANQGRLTTFVPNDPNYMGAKDLVKFTKEHHLSRVARDGSFNFHQAFSQDVENDKTYNYPRVWAIQHLFTKNVGTDVAEGNQFQTFLKPTHKLSVADVETALRHHYQDTTHDPYANQNPNEPYRPTSVFRTAESHILQVRPDLPIAIGEVEYVAWGMPAVSVYIPFYQGMTKVPKGYELGTNKADDESINWKFRKLQTLAMLNWNQSYPIVAKAFKNFEQRYEVEQIKMENEYLATYKNNPVKAQSLINTFEQNITDQALSLTNNLMNQLFTVTTHQVDQEYPFHGA